MKIDNGGEGEVVSINVKVKEIEALAKHLGWDGVTPLFEFEKGILSLVIIVHQFTQAAQLSISDQSEGTLKSCMTAILESVLSKGGATRIDLEEFSQEWDNAGYDSQSLMHVWMKYHNRFPIKK